MFLSSCSIDKSGYGLRSKSLAFFVCAFDGTAAGVVSPALEGEGAAPPLCGAFFFPNENPALGGGAVLAVKRNGEAPDGFGLNDATGFAPANRPKVSVFVAATFDPTAFGGTVDAFWSLI